ncbi:hypothetical protein LCGC14_2105950 [marine sediment metagenome]|uniref:Uncharacterized protein n=1 Tax=marine sediment metagenome TaxID=412755 RepID=A0A0F9H4X9_9ZZZZ
MIAYINTNKKSLILHTNTGKHEVPFSKIQQIEDYLEDAKVYYITNAIEVNAIDIVNLVNSLEGKKPQKQMSQSGNQYIHCIAEGAVYVRDVKFKNKYDLHFYDEKMKETIKKDISLQNLLNTGQLEIINETQRKKLLKGLKLKNRQTLNRDKLKDASLDKIIIDGTVDDFINNPQDDVIGINMDGEEEDIVIETEIEKNLKIIRNVEL